MRPVAPDVSCFQGNSESSSLTISERCKSWIKKRRRLTAEAAEYADGEEGEEEKKGI